MTNTNPLEHGDLIGTYWTLLTRRDNHDLYSATIISEDSHKHEFIVQRMDGCFEYRTDNFASALAQFNHLVFQATEFD